MQMCVAYISARGSRSDMPISHAPFALSLSKDRSVSRVVGALCFAKLSMNGFGSLA